MIVYSITDRRSLDEAQDIYRFCQRVKDEEQVPAVSARQRWLCVAMLMYSAVRVRCISGIRGAVRVRCTLGILGAVFMHFGLMSLLSYTH